MEAFRSIALLLVAAALFPAHSRAKGEERRKYEKENDVQLRAAIAFEKKLSARFSLGLSEELRTRDNASHIDRLHTEVNAAFRLTPWLKVNAAYALISVLKRAKATGEDQWKFRHRATASFTLSHEVAPHLTLSLKERVQLTHYAHSHFDRREKSAPLWGMKSKLQAEYKWRQCPFVPFVYVELCNTLNAPRRAGGNYVDKVRSGLGTTLRLDKHNSLTFLYRFDYGLEKKVKVKPSTGQLKSLTYSEGYTHVVGATYKFRF